MKLEINTLYWDNVDSRVKDAHNSVLDKLGFGVNYYTENTRHGAWMDRIMKHSESDIVGFLDGDCVPLSKDAIINAASFAGNHESFIGIAQASNHIPPMSHIYAAPAFFFISKKCWEKVNTSFLETKRSDVAEEFCYVAEEKGIKYRCIYPITFEQEPKEGIWPLSNYGYYGIGTTFGRHCYHLYQSRENQNIELFIKRCKEIVNGVFDNSKMISSTNMNYKGKIVR
jgi:hypothetical protein